MARKQCADSIGKLGNFIGLVIFPSTLNYVGNKLSFSLKFFSQSDHAIERWCEHFEQFGF